MKNNYKTSTPNDGSKDNENKFEQPKHNWSLQREKPNISAKKKMLWTT